MNINTINDMIDTLLRARDLLGGDATFAVVNDNGFLKLARNDNIVVSNGHLIVDASDWGGVPVKDMDF